MIRTTSAEIAQEAIIYRREAAAFKIDLALLREDIKTTTAELSAFSLALKEVPPHD